MTNFLPFILVMILTSQISQKTKYSQAEWPSVTSS